MSRCEVLPAGHRGRPAAEQAFAASAVTAAALTAFAWTTTQMHAVRAGSPWQDDPYDGVVSFTEFLTPALAALMVTRGLLYRRSRPQPLFRVSQLLRAAAVVVWMAAGTAATDWLAVALRADRPLWNHTTRWLIVALAILTSIAVASLVLLRRAFRLLPAPERPPSGDWLDDVAALSRVLAAHLPRAGRRICALIGGERAIGFARRHVTALAAVASLAADASITAAQAVGEGWTSPVLVLTATAIGAGGFFAFCMLCNKVLFIAVRRDASGARRERGPVHRTARLAGVVGCLALPVCAVMRNGIWLAAGQRGEVDSPARFAAVTIAGGLATGMLAFGAALIRTTVSRASPAGQARIRRR